MTTFFSSLTKSIMALALAAIVLSIFSCQGVDGSMGDLEVRLGFEKVPGNNTCTGADVSPRIEIGGLNSSSVAVIVDDIDAPSGTFTHWIIWNIEPANFVPENIPKGPTLIKPIKAVQGTNSFGSIGYMGPCPPKGKPHRYYFRVYGLNKMLDLNPGATKKDLESAMKGHILQQGEALATYQR